MFIHIGLPKTGTTTIQNRLFVKHKGLRYIGKSFEDMSVRPITQKVALEDTLRFDAAECRHLFQEVIDRKEGSGPLLLSQELFASSRTDLGATAARLKEIFGEARIIFVPREPISWLRSSYYFWWMYADPKEAVPFEKWVERHVVSEPRREDWVRNIPWMRGYRGCLHFHTLASHYAELFGKENVGIFPYEELAKNPAGFAGRICRFMGIDEELGAELIRHRDRKGPSQAEMAYQAVLKKSRVARGVAKVVPRRLKDSAKGVLEQRYGRANVTPPAELIHFLNEEIRPELVSVDRDWDLNLERLGYPVGSTGYSEASAHTTITTDQAPLVGDAVT